MPKSKNTPTSEKDYFNGMTEEEYYRTTAWRVNQEWNDYARDRANLERHLSRIDIVLRKEV